VTLNQRAPFGGAQVTIEARRRTIVTVPNTVLVPEGAVFATFSIATDPLHAVREKPVEVVATYDNVSISAIPTVVPSAQAATTHRPVAICASLALLPCVAQSSHRVIKTLGVQDGSPPPAYRSDAFRAPVHVLHTGTVVPVGDGLDFLHYGSTGSAFNTTRMATAP
jgi:hypothetical protein